MYHTDYNGLIDQVTALVRESPHFIANLANVSALIYSALEDINWAGFYLSEGEILVLGPFQGNAAHVEIPYGQGVCGTAAEKNTTQVVEDVHTCNGYICCDVSSKSEIVVPIRANGKVAGVLDIDSHVLARFTGEDRDGLERLAAVLGKLLFI